MNDDQLQINTETLLHDTPSQILIQNKKRNNSIILMSKIILFFLGLFNNSGYVVVLSAASDMAHDFGYDKSMSLFSGCMVFFSVAVKVISAKYLLKVYHKIRVGIAVSFFIMGVTSIILAYKFMSFPLSLFGTMLLGMGGAFGDSAIQGFMKAFPSEIFVGYSSGTGGAGLFGSFYYLFFKAYHFDPSQIFFYLYPAYITYFFLFFILVIVKGRFDENNALINPRTESVENKETSINVKLSISIIPHILSKVYHYSIYFGLVYFFEYSTFGFLADSATKKYHEDSFLIKYSLQIVLCSYQTAVFLSRSSLQIFKLKRLDLLCLIQGLFFVLWVCLATFLNFSVYALIGLIFNVGLVAGFSYVNTIYTILNDVSISKGEKEVCLNVNGMFSDFGIIMSSVVGYIFKHYIAHQ
jgi:battenin